MVEKVKDVLVCGSSLIFLPVIAVFEIFDMDCLHIRMIMRTY